MLIIKYIIYMVEQLNINIDELTKLIYNIINNDTFSIEDNNILTELMKNYKNLEKYNTQLKDELEELKLYSSSLKESIDPLDEQVNFYVKKYSKLKEKYNEMSNKNNKLLNQNNKLIIEHNKLIKEIKIIFDKKENDKQNFKTLLTQLESKIINIDKQKKQLEQDNLNKELHIKMCETLNDTLQNKINELEETNNKHKKHIEELELKLLELPEERKQIFISKPVILNDKQEIKENYITTDTQAIMKNIFPSEKPDIKQSVKIDETLNEIISNSEDSKNYVDVSKILNIFTDSYFEDETPDKQDEIKQEIKQDEIIKINNNNIDIFDKHFINKRTDKKNAEFYKEELQKPIKYNTGETKRNYDNITYSTDYMVSYLKNDNKIKTYYSNDKFKQKAINSMEIIREDEDENKIIEAPKQEIKAPNIIKQAPNFEIEAPKNNLKGGNKQNKTQIHLIDDVKKMVIGGELTTLTEQDINIDDKKKVQLIYTKKYRRYKRQKDKQDILLNELK